MLIAPKIFFKKSCKKRNYKMRALLRIKFIKDGVDLKSLFLESPDQFSMTITNFSKPI